MEGRSSLQAALRCRERLRDIFFLGTAMSSTPPSMVERQWSGESNNPWRAAKGELTGSS